MDSEVKSNRISTISLHWVSFITCIMSHHALKGRGGQANIHFRVFTPRQKAEGVLL